MPAFGVLFVCVGNICRSPFAERLLRRRLSEAGAAAGDFEVVSAGIMTREGAPMSVPMQVRLEELGGSADGFASRQLQPPMVQRAGLVLTATREIRSYVLGESPAALRRTFTILELANLAPDAPHGLPIRSVIHDCDSRRSTGRREDADLPDPINQPEIIQDRVARRLDAAISVITSMLVENSPDDPTVRTAGGRARG